MAGGRETGRECRLPGIAGRGEEDGLSVHLDGGRMERVIRSSEETKQGGDTPEAFLALDGGLEAKRQIHAGNAWVDVERAATFDPKPIAAPVLVQARPRSPFGNRRPLVDQGSAGIVDRPSRSPISRGSPPPSRRYSNDRSETGAKPKHDPLKRSDRHGLGEQQVAFAHVFDESTESSAKRPGAVHLGADRVDESATVRSPSISCQIMQPMSLTPWYSPDSRWRRTPPSPAASVRNAVFGFFRRLKSSSITVS